LISELIAVKPGAGPRVENYFNYFTEIEEHFCRRRGSLLTVSSLDWALMETWKDAGIPLEAVLRGIDASFDHYDRRPTRAKSKRINGLAWCAQEVLSAAEEMNEAAAGSQRQASKSIPGLGPAEIAAYLARNAAALHGIAERTSAGALRTAARECAASLRELAEAEKARSAQTPQAHAPFHLDELERNLTVLEERLLAALTVSAAETDLVELRAEADREIAPYRNKMPGFQIEQLRQQFVHKRLLEKAKIPRLSLFYL